ncbi:MAG: hypothetical protein U5L00_03775 [Desulfovermiculus sp.]|nr:hypothetical protein [Desulfovermiculus sp.]
MILALKLAYLYGSQNRVEKSEHAYEVFEYEIDYQRAREKGAEIARRIVSEHPGLSYKIVMKPEKGVYIKLYGEDEDLIHNISDGMSEQEAELLLARTPAHSTVELYSWIKNKLEQ